MADEKNETEVRIVDPAALSDQDLELVAGGNEAPTRCAVEVNGMYYVHETYYLSAEA